MIERLIWVNIPGGVMGFEYRDIEAFNREYKKLEKYGVDYWNFFNYYFQDDLAGRVADGFSALWNDQDVYLLLADQMNQ